VRIELELDSPAGVAGVFHPVITLEVASCGLLFVREQMEAVRVYQLKAPMGHFSFGVSMETSDFFKDEAKRCRDNAGAAATKADQESWLNMASRWEELLLPSDERVKAAQTLLPWRTIYNKNKKRWGT
jgi:hypothetical protein